MSKRKKQDPAAGTFRHDPFRALKGIAVKDRPSAAPPNAPAPSAAAPEDPEELFRRAMHGARPLHEEPEAGAAAPHPARTGKAEQPDAPALDHELFLNAMRSVGTSSFRERPDDDETEEDAGRRSASSRMRQLKKGAIRIGQELDLHGSLKDEALRRLEHFIASSAARGLPAVLVITGKGINSAEGPVLQGAVAQWLRGPGARHVAEFHPAPRNKGGSGAYVVFLRKS